MFNKFERERRLSTTSWATRNFKGSQVLRLEKRVDLCSRIRAGKWWSTAWNNETVRLFGVRRSIFGNYFSGVRRSTRLFGRVFFGSSIFDLKYLILVFSSSIFDCFVVPNTRLSVFVGPCGRQTISNIVVCIFEDLEKAKHSVIWMDLSSRSMLEILVLTSQRLKSQRLKRSSASQKSIWTPSYDLFAIARSLGRSVARSLGRSIARSLDRSVAWSLGRSVARSLDRSIGRSVARPIDRSIDRSIARSIARSIDRSIARVSWRIISEVGFSNYRCAGELFTRFDVRLKLLSN